MNSLRTRLIIGFSFLAVIPLAVAMVLLTSRVRAVFEAEAAERLNTSLSAIRSAVTQDAQSESEKLALLSKDPTLRRLYFLRSAWSQELNDYLDARRSLMGLDLLTIADTSGTIVGASAGPAGTQTLLLGSKRAPRDSGPAMMDLPDSSGLLMEVTAPILSQKQSAGTLRGGVVLDAETLRRLGRSGGFELALRDGKGRTVAATTGKLAGRAVGAGPRVELGGQSYLALAVPLDIGAPPCATLLGLASMAGADRAIASFQVVSALLALLGLAIAVALATLWSRQVSRPVERLAALSQRLARGDWDEPIAIKSVRELETLVAALDRMRGDLRTYRERLLASERQAAWSQMARKVAHEIKNPLTPIAISVADLKRSYEQNRPDFPAILDQAVRTVEEEVETLRRLLQEFSDYGRFPAPRLEACRASDLLADVEALYSREASSGRLDVARPVPEITLEADRGQIRQALINLVKNGLEATGSPGRVSVTATKRGGSLEVSIADTGPGLTPDQKANLFAPGFTTKPAGSGLGLTIVERIVSDHHGSITVEDNPPHGTVFRIRLPLAGETTS